MIFSNLSIRSLAAIIVFVSVCLFLLIGLFAKTFSAENYLSFPLLGIGVLAIGVFYFFTYYLLRRYIFDRLRVIYKFINTSKKKTSNEKGKLLISIDKVNEDVKQWAKDTEERIESLKTLDNYRKNFVGNVSHELKTPIFSLQGYLHTLIDGGIYDENINLKYIKRAAENADRLQHIVEDLEAIGQMESGKMELDLERFDIKELIKEVFIDQKRQVKRLNTTLVLNSNSEIPLIVMADKESIRQVLNNLITNSLKYGDVDGKTQVSLYTIENSVLVEVKDDGIGIEEHHLKHLFDRFYRVDSSRSRAQGGSGLGLSIVKHIVEAHGQSISVSSKLGEGTTFGFTLDKG